MADAALALRLRPCGPVVDAPAAERAREALGRAGAAVWPALAPAFAASPYLAGLATRDPDRLVRLLDSAPEVRLDALLAETDALADAPDPAPAAAALRALKAELHLLTALADLGGVWDLAAVTGALSRFADAAVRAALALAVRQERAAGRMGGEGVEAPGLFVLALGKHGAGELNYSSDIDVSVFYDPEVLPAVGEPARLALRLTQAMARLLSERTAEGYVFRVDLRLRPDPASTPVAVPVEAALAYYETVGQNWERAAMIKARPVAGDLAAGTAFLQALQPFVWRRALDYAAIADIHAILRQIRSKAGAPAPVAAGANLKLGVGGIREIEFYAQTQQLILGGRQPVLRTPRTLDALDALTAAGQVEPEARDALAAAYRRLRAWEHRVQMLADEQTHALPTEDAARARVAALAGLELGPFDVEVARTRAQVCELSSRLFAEEEPLSSRFGPLVFTGVEDDPETLATLARMGFSDPPSVAAQVRAWHHGRVNATRTERGRELFTRLAPRLLDAAAGTGAPDAAFARFGEFFAGLTSGVQVQSLLLGQPALLELVVQVLALSPRLATILARRPAALDALVDSGFFAPLGDSDFAAALGPAVAAARGFEAAMEAVRRTHREEAFRIGVQAMTGTADAAAAGRAFAELADACVGALAPAALAEVERLGGAFEGEAAVVALGKFGGREMTAGSDLDLMVVYRAPPGMASEGKGWAAETVYARFTQRLVAALSAPTAEGELYAVDLQLRPSGTAGPVSASLAALEGYYAGEAQTWEFLALTRARVAWATSPAFAEAVALAIETALRRPRDPAATAADVREMRALMTRERPPSGPWDLKLSPGGLVDVEFAAQLAQLVHAAEGGPLRANTGEALAALEAAGFVAPPALFALLRAWALQTAIGQVLRVAIRDGADPSREPARLKALVARAGGAEDFAALEAALADARAEAHAAFRALLESTERSASCVDGETPPAPFDRTRT